MTDTTLPSQPIYDKAGAELAANAQLRAETEQGLLALQQEQAQITQRRAALHAEHATLETQHQQRREQAEQAQTYAELAQGSLSSPSAIAALKEAQSREKAAEKALAAFMRGCRDEEAKFAEREPALLAAVAQSEALIRDLDTRRIAIEQAKTQAWSAMGDEALIAVNAKLHKLSEDVRATTSPSVAAQAALAQGYQEASEALGPWTALLQQVRRDHPAMMEDGVTRVVNAYIAFLDVLALEGSSPTFGVAAGKLGLAAQMTLNEHEMQTIAGYYASGPARSLLLQQKQQAAQEIVRRHQKGA